MRQRGSPKNTLNTILSYAISNQNTYPLSIYLPYHSLSFILPSNTTNNLHFPHSTTHFCHYLLETHYIPSFPMLFPIKTLIHCPFITLITHFPLFFLEIQQITRLCSQYTLLPLSPKNTLNTILSYAISNQNTYPLSIYLPYHSLSFILPSNTTNNLHFPHSTTHFCHYLLKTHFNTILSYAISNQNTYPLSIYHPHHSLSFILP